MNDYMYIFFTIFVITAMIYILYKIILSSDKESNNQELQISSKDILQEITILHKQKKYNIVEKLARNYLEKKPKETEIRLILTKVLYETRKYYEAINQAKFILNIQPDNIAIYPLLSNCYVKIDKPMKAIDILLQMLRKDPENIIAIKTLAPLYVDTNQIISAIKMYELLDEMLDNDLEKVKTKITTAELYTKMDKIDSAINKYNEILEIYPEDVNSKKQLIALYELTSEFDIIIDLASQLLETDNDNDILWALEKLMYTHIELHDFDKALEFANLIKAHSLSDKLQANENIAKILLKQGQIDESINILNSLILSNPGNISLKKSLSRAYELKQNFDSSTHIYKQILDQADIHEIEKIRSEISDLYCNWAMFLFSQNNNNEAFKKFIIALEYNDKNPTIYFKLGNVNKEIKNFNEAVSQYKKAIELDNKNPIYYWSLAECYEGLENIYEQKKVLIDCLKYSPENPLVNYKLGLIYNLQNDYLQAVFYLKEAIRLDADFIEAKRKLALVFEHNGNKEEAIHIYEDILIQEPENEEITNNLKMLRQ